MPKRQALSRAPSTRHTSDSNTYRFFVDPHTISDSAVHIADAALAHQLTAVLRLDVGQVVTLLDNTGMAYRVTLDQLTKHDVYGTVIERSEATGEPRLKLVLYVALIRGERFEWVLQKGTELGVSAFIPIVSERSLGADGRSVDASKLDRWRRIIREAAEQARRGRLPELGVAQPFTAACTAASEHGRGLLLWEGDGGQSLRTLVQQADSATSWAVFSGPEGGWSDREVAQATEAGLALATLGPRTLRAETAPLAAAMAILFANGDLD